MIRKFEDKDLETVMHIWLHTNIHAHAFIASDYWLSRFDTVKEMMPQAEVYVYEDHDQIQGFIGMMDTYIAGIFVDQTQQSKGIGTQLLSMVKMHNHDLSLSVYVKNHSAIHFYEKAGFHIQNKQVDQDTKEEEYCMTWEKS